MSHRCELAPGHDRGWRARGVKQQAPVHIFWFEQKQMLNQDDQDQRWKAGSVTIPNGSNGQPGKAGQGDLQWRLQMSEQVRKKTVDRIVGVLRNCGWEEPQTRPKGRAFEDVLISVCTDTTAKQKPPPAGLTGIPRFSVWGRSFGWCALTSVGARLFSLWRTSCGSRRRNMRAKPRPQTLPVHPWRDKPPGAPVLLRHPLIPPGRSTWTPRGVPKNNGAAADGHPGGAACADGGGAVGAGQRDRGRQRRPVPPHPHLSRPGAHRASRVASVRYYWKGLLHPAREILLERVTQPRVASGHTSAASARCGCFWQARRVVQGHSHLRSGTPFEKHALLRGEESVKGGRMGQAAGHM